MNLLKEYLPITLRGILMGSADVVPGVSGGTVALIVGIYGRLVSAIASFDLELLDLIRRKKIKEAADHIDFRFLAALGLGIGTAVVSLAKLITWLILNRPIPTWSLFFGLILASTFLVYRMVEKWDLSGWIALIAGAAFAYWISGRLPAEASHTYPVLFGSGMIAICAMILPGISGSFILVVLGQYLFVLQAIHDRNLPVVIVFAAGCGIGLIAFTKVLKYLLRNYKSITMACLCGLMLGSLRKIWPFKLEAPGQEMLKAKHRVQINFLPDTFDDQVIWAIAMVVIGLAVVFLAEYFAGKPEKKTSL
jgi:putative membrane protein